MWLALANIATKVTCPMFSSFAGTSRYIELGYYFQQQAKAYPLDMTDPELINWVKDPSNPFIAVPPSADLQLANGEAILAGLLLCLQHHHSHVLMLLTFEGGVKQLFPLRRLLHAMNGLVISTV